MRQYTYFNVKLFGESSLETSPETPECSFKSLIFPELEYSGYCLLEYDWALYTTALRMCQPFDQVTQLLEIYEKEMLINVHNDAH